MDLRPLRQSKALDKVGYEGASRTLCVLFRHGGRYDYLRVPPEIYMGKLASPHPWSEYGTYIKQNYECRPIRDESKPVQ